MLKSLQLFLLFSILWVKIQSIYSNGNFYTSEQKNVYFIDDEQKYSWFDALTTCTNNNMALATIDTKEKSDEITMLLRYSIKYVNPLWIGAVANGNDRHYVWISNGQRVTFTNWYQGEPDFYNNNEYCLQTGWSDKLQWNDHECHKTFGLICEYSSLEKEINHEADQKIKELQKELDNTKEKLKDELAKEQQLQEELNMSEEKLQAELVREQQLQEDFEKYKETLQEELNKQQQLQKDLDNYRNALGSLQNDTKPGYNNKDGDIEIKPIFININ